MATKKVKGQKLNLAEFVGPQNERDLLPSGPSGYVEEDRDRPRGHRGERAERPERSFDRDREEEGPSRADEADKWRRAAPTPGRAYNDRSERSFDRDSSFRRERSETGSEETGAGHWRGRGQMSERDRTSDADAEWRRHRSTPRDRDDAPEGERRGFGFGRAGGDRLNDRERSNDRYEPPRGDRDRFSAGERSNDRYELRGDRFSERGNSDRFGDRDRSNDRFGSERSGSSDRFGSERSSASDRFGDRSERSERFGDRNDRFGGRDRDRDSSERYSRRERDDAPTERPAHLVNLLKKQTDAPSTSPSTSTSTETDKPTESATERMERLSLEREQQRSKPAEPSAAAAPSRPPIDELKQPELAPIKLSTTRRSPAAAERLEPTRATPSNSVLRAKKEAAAPVVAATATPAPVPIVMDESRYDSNVLKSVVAAGSKKQNPIEIALQDKQSTIKDGDLDSLKTMNLASQTNEIAAVLARSISAKTLHLSNLASTITALNTDDARALFGATLSSINQRKGEAELMSFLDSSSVNAFSILVPSNDAAEIDRVLSQHSLTMLKPVRDLSSEIKSKLSSSTASDVTAFIDSEIGSKTASVSPAVAKIVATHVFDLVYANAKSPDFSVISTWAPALKRVSTDSATKLAVCFVAQGVWNKATTAPKGAFKETFIALEKAGVMQTEDFAAWRDDLKDKTPGKPKALLQVGAWIKLAEEEAKKRMPRHAKDEESDEDDEDEDDSDLDSEDEDEYDPAYPKRR